jgi:hypothetical protein
MDVRSSYRARMVESIHRVDLRLLHCGHRLSEVISEYRYLIAVLLIGFVVWSVVFNIALVDYLNTRYWNSRTVWLGPFPNPGEFNLFGYTILYQFEGYSDYSFYYVHWGYNLLYGVMPYSGSFGYLNMQGIINQNGAYIFPPLTAYLYGFGIALGSIIGPGNWGIGLLFAIFGYSTTLPVYGIARELSKNPRVGEIAALTYTINPLVLYHIDYLWLNPAPFYFFFFTGFYALIRGRRHIGTILIVTAALFKQTAWFLGIPLVVYLIVRPRERKKDIVETEKSLGALKDGASVEERKKESITSKFAFLLEYFDLPGFTKSAILAASFVGAVVFPFIIAQPDFLKYWSLALGSFSFEGNFVDPIPYNVPVRLPVLPIMFGFPEVAEFMDSVIRTSAPLFFGVTIFAGLMILIDRYKGEEHAYLRRILFLTMLLMLWTDLVGARGAFKYYFTVFGPFFSIFSSSKMTRGQGEHVNVSASMVWMPILFSLSILIPDRNYYFLYVLVIFIAYILAPLFDKIYDFVKRPFRFLKKLLSSKTSLSLGTVTIDEEDSVSTASRILAAVTVIASLIAGSFLLTLGVFVCFARLTASLEVIMEFLLLMGAIIFMGVHLLSIALNGLLSTKERRTDLNYILRTLSFTLVVFLFVFALDTYILGSTVEMALEKQLMIISSALIIIWSLGVLVRIENRSRIISDLVLLLSCAIGTWSWLSLGDVLFFLFGLTCIFGLVIHFLITSNAVLMIRYRERSESLLLNLNDNKPVAIVEG